MKIFVVGDIVGNTGVNKVKQVLPQYIKKENIDFVIANGENSADGMGITSKIFKDLMFSGVNVVTMGNHTWGKKDIFNIIEDKNLLRPANYPKDILGNGYGIYECNGKAICVINLIGRVDMNVLSENPFNVVRDIINEVEHMVDIIIVDFHAEATAEKICLGKYLSEIGAMGFFGTHTHVQTADEQIINNMAYITDAGFCGATDSVIGMEYATSLRRMTTLLPERYEVAVNPPCTINAVEVSIVDETVTAIKRINVNVDMKDKELEVSVETNSV